MEKVARMKYGQIENPYIAPDQLTKNPVLY